ncbi:hypothetical protein T439DRAFT_361124 [Meredithblackwellia eburnea MCA 4105]
MTVAFFPPEYLHLEYEYPVYQPNTPPLHTFLDQHRQLTPADPEGLTVWQLEDDLLCQLLCRLEQIFSERLLFPFRPVDLPNVAIGTVEIVRRLEEVHVWRHCWGLTLEAVVRPLESYIADILNGKYEVPVPLEEVVSELGKAQTKGDIPQIGRAVREWCRRNKRSDVWIDEDVREFFIEMEVYFKMATTLKWAELRWLLSSTPTVPKHLQYLLPDPHFKTSHMGSSSMSLLPLPGPFLPDPPTLEEFRRAGIETANWLDEGALNAKEIKVTVTAPTNRWRKSQRLSSVGCVRSSPILSTSSSSAGPSRGGETLEEREGVVAPPPYNEFD